MVHIQNSKQRIIQLTTCIQWKFKRSYKIITKGFWQEAILALQTKKSHKHFWLAKQKDLPILRIAIVVPGPGVSTIIWKGKPCSLYTFSFWAIKLLQNTNRSLHVSETKLASKYLTPSKNKALTCIIRPLPKFDLSQ